MNNPAQTNFYDEKNNFLIVRKDDKGNLLDYVFFHYDDTKDCNFFVHFDSYISDTPLKVYKFKEVTLPKENTNDIVANIPIDSPKEQNWKKIRVSGILPSKWRMLFEKIEEIIKA